MSRSYDEENQQDYRKKRRTVLSFISMAIPLLTAFFTWKTVHIQWKQTMPIIDVSPQFSEDWSRYESMTVTSDGRTKGGVNVKVYPYLRTTAYINVKPDNWNVKHISNDTKVITAEEFSHSPFPKGYYELNIPILSSDSFFNIYFPHTQNGAIISIQDSEYSKLLTEYLSNAVNDIEEVYDITYATFSLEYFLEMEYSDLLNCKHYRVYQIITGISEGFYQVPGQNLIIDETFNLDKVLVKPEKTDDRKKRVDLEEQDPEYVYRFVKEEVERYTPIEYFKGVQEDTGFYAEYNRPEYVLIIEKDTSKETFYSRMVTSIYEQVKDNAWKYGYEVSIIS